MTHNKQQRSVLILLFCHLNWRKHPTSSCTALCMSLWNLKEYISEKNGISVIEKMNIWYRKISVHHAIAIIHVELSHQIYRNSLCLFVGNGIYPVQSRLTWTEIVTKIVNFFICYTQQWQQVISQLYWIRCEYLMKFVTNEAIEFSRFERVRCVRACDFKISTRKLYCITHGGCSAIVGQSLYQFMLVLNKLSKFMFYSLYLSDDEDIDVFTEMLVVIYETEREREGVINPNSSSFNRNRFWWISVTHRYMKISASFRSSWMAGLSIGSQRFGITMWKKNGFSRKKRRNVNFSKCLWFSACRFQYVHGRRGENGNKNDFLASFIRTFLLKIKWNRRIICQILKLLLIDDFLVLLSNVSPDKWQIELIFQNRHGKMVTTT